MFKILTSSASKYILLLAGVFFISDLFFIYNEQNNLRFFSKTALLPLLLLYYVLSLKKSQIRPNKVFIIGLFFSWLGDVFLLLPSGFLFGLGSFLLAHCCYGLCFYRLSNRTFRLNYLLLFLILVYLFVFLYFLFPYLKELKIPVTLYALAISSMLYLGYNTKKGIAYNAFKNLLLGALLFVISDSVLALHLFVFPTLFHELVVMITYVLAQFFLIQAMVLKGNIAL